MSIPIIPIVILSAFGIVAYDLLSTTRSPSVTPPAPPAPKPKVAPAPAPSPGPSPAPSPGPRPTYRWPVGSVVNANVGRLGRREPGIQPVKIIGNTPGPLGDYEVIASDCFLPDSWCSSEWISQGDIQS